MVLKPDTQASGLTVSLRLKLTLWMVLIFTTLQVTLAVIVLLYERRSISELSNERVMSRAVAVAASIRAANFAVDDAELLRMTQGDSRFATFERFIIVLYTEAGDVEASSARPAPPASDVIPKHFTAGGEAMVIRETVPGLHRPEEEQLKGRVALQMLTDGSQRRHVLMVARTDSYFDSVVRATQQIMLIALAIGVFASAVASWMIARLATAPLADLMRIAGSLSPEGIEEEVHLASSHPEVGVLERELLEVRAKLRAALQAKDRFVSSVSHELKTPIAVLLTEAQTLRQEGLSPEARKFAQSVAEEMRRLGGMVESFLMLAKLHGGKELVEVDEHNMNEIVMAAIGTCHKMARQYHVSLAPVLFDGEQMLNVSGNADLLRVMIDNLIHNAIRFSPENQSVIIRLADSDNECEIAVRDFGPGVPEEMLDKVFERFVQASTDAPRTRGYGLGLSIAQGIAELHGGRITVRNMPEGGCEFVIRLPLVAQASDAQSVEDEPVAE